MSLKSLRVFMRTIFASLLIMALATVILAQGRPGGGRPGGGPSDTGGVGMGGPSRGGMNPNSDRSGVPGDRSNRPERGPHNGSETPADPARAARDNNAQANRDLQRHPDIAARLNTTPDALRAAYQTALATNSNLKFGQFVSAQVIAQNLSAAHPNITANAILSGLASGNSLGQTLQNLGLSADQAKASERAARKPKK